jgi:hypothetical protein
MIHVGRAGTADPYQESAMIRTMLDLTDFELRAPDGPLGPIQDVYFDDADWTVRYLTADVSAWLPGLTVLLAPTALESVDREQRTMRTRFDRQQMQNSPPALEDDAVSKRNAERLGDPTWQPFWLTTSSQLGATAPITPLRAGVAGEKTGATGSGADLRSAQELLGYAVECEGQRIGMVTDLAYDDETWGIQYLVVDTAAPAEERRILIAPDWTHAIDWVEPVVRLDLDCEAVARAPGFETSTTIDEAYRRRLHEHYGRTASRPHESRSGKGSR